MVPVENPLNIDPPLPQVPLLESWMSPTDQKINYKIVLGGFLIAVAAVGGAAVIACAVIYSPLILCALVPAGLIGLVGYFFHWDGSLSSTPGVDRGLVMSKPEGMRPPVGFVNPGNDCWLHAALQLIFNAPGIFKHVDYQEVFSLYQTYSAAKGALPRGAQDLRRALHKSTSGTISLLEQDDPALFFENVFGKKPPFRLQESVDGQSEIERQYSLISIPYGGVRGAKFAAEFADFFDHWISVEEEENKRHATLHFSEVPEDLLIHIGRYDERMNANHDYFEVPYILELPLQAVREDPSPRPNYICQGFIVHQSVLNLLGMGHYIAYVNRGGQWYLCNDHSITPVSTKAALTQMSFGYIYHFHRIPPQY